MDIKSFLRNSLMLLSAVVVASCSGGANNAAGATTSLQTVTSIPGFSNQQIDIYDTSAATKAVVFLHGGDGTNYGMAHDLGLNSNNGPPSNNSINWDWLNSHQVLAVFPQGQAGKGTATWSNHVMDSGQDDVAFLQALATYIKNQYGISNIYLVGHSNGGMMANRMWCESPTTFTAYIAISGPTSAFYLLGDPDYTGASCSPQTFAPYYAIVGSADTVLDDATNAGTFQGNVWTIDPGYVANPAAWVNPSNPDLIGEWHQYSAIRSHQMCPGQPQPIFSDGQTAGNVTTWSTCGGQLKLQEVNGADHWISSNPFTGDTSNSLQTKAGTDLIDSAAQFISDNGG